MAKLPKKDAVGKLSVPSSTSLLHIVLKSLSKDWKLNNKLRTHRKLA